MRDAGFCVSISIISPIALTLPSGFRAVLHVYLPWTYEVLVRFCLPSAYYTLDSSLRADRHTRCMPSNIGLIKQ